MGGGHNNKLWNSSALVQKGLRSCLSAGVPVTKTPRHKNGTKAVDIYRIKTATVLYGPRSVVPCCIELVTAPTRNLSGHQTQLPLRKPNASIAYVTTGGRLSASSILLSKVTSSGVCIGRGEEDAARPHYIKSHISIGYTPRRRWQQT